jgi:hypothetical protein
MDMKYIKAKIEAIDTVLEAAKQKITNNEFPPQHQVALNPIKAFLKLANKLIGLFNEEQNDAMKTQHFYTLCALAREHHNLVSALTQNWSGVASYVSSTAVHYAHKYTRTGSWLEKEYLNKLEPILDSFVSEFSKAPGMNIIGDNDTALIKKHQPSSIESLIYKLGVPMADENSEMPSTLLQLEKRAMVALYFSVIDEKSHNKISSANALQTGGVIGGLVFAGPAGAIAAMAASVLFKPELVGNAEKVQGSLERIEFSALLSSWKTHFNSALHRETAMNELLALPLGYEPTTQAPSISL